MNIWIERFWMMSVQAIFVIVVVLLLRFLFRNYPKRYSYGLWLLVLVRLLCPVFIESNYSLLPTFTVDYDQTASVLDTNRQQLQTTDGQAAFYTAKEEKDKQAASNNTALEDQSPFGWAHLLYLSGGTLFLTITLVQYLGLKKQIRFAVHEKGNIWLCENICSPFVTGLFKPRIYLPYGLSEEEREYILLHEQAHILHKDPFVRQLETVALALHWWNPFVWYAFFKMNQDMEMFCDETALDGALRSRRKAYSSTLLAFSIKQSHLTPTISFGESNTELRIKNVLRRKKKSVLAGAILAILALICAIVFLTVPHKERRLNLLGVPTQSGVYTAELSNTADRQFLCKADNVYGDEESGFASIFCDVYLEMDGEIRFIGALEGNGTAYPVTYDGTAFYVAGGHEIAKYVFDETYEFLIRQEYIEEIYDTEGNVSYQKTKGQKVDKAEENDFLQLFAEYERAEVISFTDQTADKLKQEIQTEMEMEGETEQEIQEAVEKERESDYEWITGFQKEEVEAFAAEIRQAVLEENWTELSYKIAYPITISGEECQSAEEFQRLDFEQLVTEEFLTAIEKESCKNMFFNWQGIMLGETGQVWFAEVADSNHSALKIIAIHFR